MTERDGAAVHVELVVGDAQLAGAIDGLRRERLVDLEQIDVLDAKPGLREQLADRGHRADAHDVRIHARHRVAAQASRAA